MGNNVIMHVKQSVRQYSHVRILELHSQEHFKGQKDHHNSINLKPNSRRLVNKKINTIIPVNICYDDGNGRTTDKDQFLYM